MRVFGDAQRSGQQKYTQMQMVPGQDMNVKSKPTLLRDLTHANRNDAHQAEYEEAKAGHQTMSEKNHSSDGEGAYTEFENLNYQD